MQSSKRLRSPEAATDSGKKPKTWNPRDQAQVPVRKCPFPTKSLDKETKQKNKLDRDRGKGSRFSVYVCI